MLLAGTGFTIFTIKTNDDSCLAISLIISILIGLFGILLFCGGIYMAIASHFADDIVLSDGSYYKILSVTKNPDDPKEQYVIYTQGKNKIRDVCLTSTNSIPIGMVRWNYADETFIPLSADTVPK